MIPHPTSIIWAAHRWDASRRAADAPALASLALAVSAAHLEQAPDRGLEAPAATDD